MNSSESTMRDRLSKHPSDYYNDIDLIEHQRKTSPFHHQQMVVGYLDMPFQFQYDDVDEEEDSLIDDSRQLNKNKEQDTDKFYKSPSNIK